LAQKGAALPAFNFSSLRTRLLILVIIASIPALAFLLFSASEQRNQKEAEACAETMRMAILSANYLEQIVEGSQQVLSGLTEFTAVQNYDANACSTYLADFKKKLPIYNNIAVAKPDGNLFCSAIPFTKIINISDRPYFINAIRKKTLSFGEYQLSRINGQQQINVALPVLDKKSRVKSVVFLGIDLNAFKEKLKEVPLPEQASLTVLDRNLTVLYQYPETEKRAGVSMVNSPVTRAISGRDKGITIATGMDGIARIWAFTLVQGTDKGLHVRYAISHEAVYSEINRRLVRNLAILIVLLGMACAIAWYGGDYFIMRRVRKLIKATDVLSKGDLRVRVEVGGGPRDEIGQLGDSFNRMAAALEYQKEERKQSEINYQLLFEESKDAIFVSSVEGKYSDVNLAAVELLGYSSKDEVLALNTARDVFTNPEDRCKYVALLKENGFVKDFEVTLKRKDGKRLTALSTSTAIRNKTGDIVAYRGIVHDITERKRSEKALEESAKRLKLTLDAAHVVAWEINVDGTHTEIGPVHELFGRPKGFYHPSVSDLFQSIHPEDRQGVMSTVQSALRGELEYHVQFRVPQADGRMRWVEANGTLLRDEKGKPLRILGIARDITERKQTEQILLESENRTRLIVESLAIGVYYYRLENNDRLVFNGGNSAADRIIGVDHRIFIGKTIEEAFPPLQETELPRRYRDAAAFGIPWHTENLAYNDGRIQGIFEMHAFQTSPNNMIVAFTDISERKRAEEKLRTTLQRFYAILANMYDSILLVTNEGKIEFANQAFCDLYRLKERPEMLTELTSREIIDKIKRRYLHPDEADARIQKIVADGKPVRSEEVRMQGDQTHLRDFIPISVNGKPFGRLWHQVDITRQKQAAEALRVSEERFKRLVQHSNDIITLVDANGIQTATSGPVERITGYKPEELTGTSCFDLLHSDDREPAKKSFFEALVHPGLARRLETRYRHKKGHWITLEIVGSNLLHDPIVKAVVLNIRDITERNKLQEQLRQAMKMEAVGRLAGGIAHDFNNLLTIIIGNLELAKRGLNPLDPLAQHLNEVNNAAASAASLTRQLLAFSRKQIIEPKVLRLNDLIENLYKMLVRIVGEDIELLTSLGKEPGSVKVDPGQFEQVLVNLVVNARDAMPDGGKLMIETANVDLDESYCTYHPQARPGKFVLLAVSDTGSGMSDEVKEHIFEPFFTTKDQGRGTGLGLAMTFGLVQQAEGSIEVYSEVGHGTTFKIYLPRFAEQAEKLSRDEPALDLPAGNETVLLVEDEASVRQVALMILKELGYKVLSAPNGGEAFMLAEKHAGRIDLLMTDVVMPGMNGRDLAERLLGLHPEMKVLFTSGYTADVVVHHGVLEKNLNFIGKPYTPQSLARKMREVLDTEPR